MTYCDNINNKSTLKYFINNSVITLSNSITVSSFQFFTSNGSWIVS